MASRAARFSVRARNDQAQRWRAAADTLRLEEMSDFLRRAADELAERALEGATQTDARPAAAAAPPVVPSRRAVRPDPKNKPRGAD